MPATTIHTLPKRPIAVSSLKWQPLDIAVGATLGAACGVIFWGFNFAYMPISSVFGAILPGFASIVHAVWYFSGTLAVLILRVALTPRMQDPDTGLFHLSYLIIGLMALTMLAAAVLSWLSQNDGVPPGGKLLTPLSLSAMLAGSVMTIVSALDGFNWLLFGETPAPNEHVISGIDGVTLFFTSCSACWAA